jgi:hypothetical protein
VKPTAAPPRRAAKRFWVKYHFKTEQGIQSFTDAGFCLTRLARTFAFFGNEVSPVAFPGYVGRLVETFARAP